MNSIRRKTKNFLLLSVCTICFFFTGCTVNADEEPKLRDLDFTVLSEEMIPAELKEMIAPKQKEAFTFSYSDGENLYLCIGYGEQKTGGYSIAVNDLYLTDHNMVVNTSLLGPSGDEVTSGSPSYPYIVLKTENLDKEVIFE